MYYLENKQKSLISMVEILLYIDFFKLDINLDKFKTIDDFIDDNWEIKIEELKINFEKILRLNKIKEDLIKKQLNQFDNHLKTKNIEWLEKLLTENFVIYFKTLFDKKLQIKIISNIKNTLWDEKIDLKK